MEVQPHAKARTAHQIRSEGRLRRQKTFQRPAKSAEGMVQYSSTAGMTPAKAASPPRSLKPLKRGLIFSLFMPTIKAPKNNIL